MTQPKIRPPKISLENFEAITKNTALAPLGVKLTEIDNEHIVLTMPITNATRQPLGLLHGGISLLLAETAGSFHAAWGINLNEVVPVGIEINGSHIRSVSEGNVKAVGIVIRRSRSLIVHQVEIFHVESNRLLCTTRVTNFYKQVETA